MSFTSQVKCEAGPFILLGSSLLPCLWAACYSHKQFRPRKCEVWECFWHRSLAVGIPSQLLNLNTKHRGLLWKMRCRFLITNSASREVCHKVVRKDLRFLGLFVFFFLALWWDNCQYWVWNMSVSVRGSVSKAVEKSLIVFYTNGLGFQQRGYQKPLIFKGEMGNIHLPVSRQCTHSCLAIQFCWLSGW